MILLIAFTILSLIALIVGAILINIDINDGLGLVGIALCILSLIGLISMPMVFWNYTAAGYKTEIINAEFQTKYTQDQIFFAEDVIDEVRELKRKRIELNGNILDN